MEFRRIANYVEQVNGKYWINSFGKIYREMNPFERGNGKQGYRVVNEYKSTSYTRQYKKTLGQLRADNKIYEKIVVDSIELTILSTGEVLREMYPYISKESDNYFRSDVKLQTCIKGEEKTYHLHSLVARVFKGIRPIDAEIHHIDCNSLNNAVSNLIYLPKKEHYEIHNKSTSNSRKLEIIETFIDYNMCIL